MGVGDHDHQVYIIDFGLAKQYRDPKTHLHIPYKENCPPTGTAPYVSINNHKGVEQSRRDDLESLAYILVYFLHGSLPWYGVEPAVNKQRRNAILRRKQSSHLTHLCSACPPEFGMFLNYARTLAFDEKPDYGYLRKLFRELLVREGHQYGHPFPDGIISINPHVGTRAMTNRRKVLEAKIEKQRMRLSYRYSSLPI
jgi:casein kinase I homolog HRR25